MQKEQTIFDELNELIRKFGEFKDSRPDGTLYEFGSWLHPSAPAEGVNIRMGTTENFITATAGQMRENQEIPNLAMRGILGNLINRMVMFVKTYTKLPFQKIGLGSMDEFRILSLIDRMEDPNKSRLSQASLMEFTTINDMLKRFEKRGWVIQRKDPRDKRANTLELTTKGKKFLNSVYSVLANIQPPITGDLNDEEQQLLMNLLMRLNTYHSNYIVENFHGKKHPDD